jgi:hypothetical protein
MASSKSRIRGGSFLTLERPSVASSHNRRAIGILAAGQVSCIRQRMAPIASGIKAWSFAIWCWRAGSKPSFLAIFTQSLPTGRCGSSRWRSKSQSRRRRERARGQECSRYVFDVRI